MKSQSIPMTIDEFHRMPHKLGWKYEYWGDAAHISPSHTAIATTTMAVTPRPVSTDCLLRTPIFEDIPDLIPVYVASFADTIDYCDWESAKIEWAAQRNLTTFFDGERGEPLPASRVAIQQGEVVGAALIVERVDGRPLLDLLFVAPHWQRRGIATALLAAALNALHAAGFEKLSSRYLLGNEQSRHWHQRSGFVDEPDHFLARHYYRHYQHEVERQQEIGLLSAAELAVLITERDRWDGILKGLQAEDDRFHIVAVIPFDE